ncbi:DUF885 family protein [Sphingosinicella sp. CPCC 101087]|uniref:DUF885 domain-containing protein n=1 Tax=Sphingosinicella sp. CPCC 101087 TaxID=2497754 RepID=UPI001FB096C6|nr:DUF885 domain-containing protein [Sphingosinicella sp. CPCC 101087]
MLAPMDAERSGDAAGLPAFVDPLSDDHARALEASKRAEMAELATIDRLQLSAVDRIAYDVLRYRTEQVLSLFETGLFDVQRRAALNPSFGMHVEMPDFVSGGGARFESVEDYERGLERLEGFAGYLENVIAQLRRGVAVGQVQPRVIVDNVLSQVEAMLAIPVEDSPFYAAIANMPATIGQPERARLAAAYRRMIEERVYPGYRLWQSYLQTEYLPLASAAPGRSAMKDGAALYAAELARHTTTRMSADEIHALGRREVARIREQMEEVRQTIGFGGSLHEFFEHVRTDPRFYHKQPEQLLEHFKSIEARIWPNIPKLFPAAPRAPFEVRPLPALGDQRGTGYYRPGPPDASGPGILFFNMSMLDTRPIPTLETLTLHEGIPGHHFQLSLAQEQEDLPDVLRFGRATAYTEGWGLYAETLGRELGLFEDPYQWFGHLDMAMLRAVRLVVDTGLHAHGWSRDAAIRFMLENTSMAERDVVVEIDRYIAYPGQATSYKIGELKLQELRQRAATRLGGRFDIREFHDQVLNTGVLPLDVLEAKIDHWLEERASQVRQP